MGCEYECKYVDVAEDCCRTFYFTAGPHENPLLRAKEILQDKNVEYRNIILKIDMEGGLL
jgi:hypothetical protein